eukprot:PITA_02513
MVEEYESIMKNSVWEVVPRPADRLVVGSRWIFKVKHAVDGIIKKYKAIFVAKVFSQVYGIDYQETFAPIIRRVLYDLKQSPRAWYTRINNYLTSLGFTKIEVDVDLYYILVEGKMLIIVLYVNALILIGDEQLINSCKEDLAREFEMKDMGRMHCFLGLEVWQGDGELIVSQGKYVNEILQIFHMDICKPMETPMATNWRNKNATSAEEVDATIYKKLVGSLMYLVNT